MAKALIADSHEQALKSNSSRRPMYTLGDLIIAVSASSRNSREAAAVITDLLNSGQVILPGKSPRRSSELALAIREL
jgi:hypothetical protein